MRTSYRHKQFGTALVVGNSALILLVFWLTAQAGPHPVLLLALALLAFLLVIFSSLTVMITASSLVFWFGPGVMRKTVPLASIESAVPVRNPWYAGFGIRYLVQGILYNVSGLSAVEIVLRDGKSFRLGTDEPEKLASALREAMDRAL